jgi:hypothetical protein
LVIAFRRRALEDIPGGVGHQEEALFAMEERQAVLSRLSIEAALAQARDESFARQVLNERGVDRERCSDDRRVDAHVALYHFHSTHLLAPAAIHAGHGEGKSPAAIRQAINIEAMIGGFDLGSKDQGPEAARAIGSFRMLCRSAYLVGVAGDVL